MHQLSPSRYRKTLVVLALFIPLIVAALWHGLADITSFAWSDPVFIRDYALGFTQPTAAENYVSDTILPPLRHFELIILFAIIRPTQEQAGQLAVMYSSLKSLVFWPATIYAIFRLLSGRMSPGFAAIGGYLLISLPIGIGGPWRFGAWWFTTANITALLALYFAVRSVTTDSSRAVYATGIAIGITGLIQPAIAAFAALFVTTIFLYFRQPRDWFTAGIVGFFVGGITLRPEYLRTHVLATVENTTRYVAYPQSVPMNALLVFPVCGALVYAYKEKIPWTDAHKALLISILVLLPIWMFGIAIGDRFLEERTAWLLFPLITGSTVMYLRAAWPNWKPLESLPVMRIAVLSAAGGFSLLMYLMEFY